MKIEYFILAIICGGLIGYVGANILWLFFSCEISNGIDRMVIYIRKLFGLEN